MTRKDHQLLKKFIKLKPPAFHGIENEDAFEFILDCYERFLKLGIVQQFLVHFVTFQLREVAKRQWSDHMACRSSIFPPLTQAQFINKYLPHTLKDHKKGEFLDIEQGNMCVVAYEAKFHALFHYATNTKKDRRHLYVKYLNIYLQVPNVHMTLKQL